MSFTEQIIKGRYIYKNNGNIYSEEDFKVFHEESKNGNFIINSEVISRVSTGEFLKIFVDYKLNAVLEPLSLTVRRSLGRNNSVEKFNYSTKENLLKYSFRGTKGDGECEKSIIGNFFINAPCAVTSIMMTASKKVSPIYRTAYNVVTSKNVWEYIGPIEEQKVHVEQVQPEPVGITINNKEISATFYQLFEHDKSAAIKEQPASFYLSKYLNIPYMIKAPGGITITTEFLKNTESKYKNLF